MSHDQEKIKNNLDEQFTQPLLYWYDINGRKNLPWQTARDPYRVWVSEIMLQQTQVQTVIAYFNRFIEQFPSLDDLADAQEDEVLSLWSGLGYYSRARNLHATAKIIKNTYHSHFPRDLESLMTLPGIGPSTAAAILSQAFNQATAILDGNVKRVLTRFFLIQGWPEQAQVKKKLWDLAQACMSEYRCADYTQAIMDLGALCCTSKKPQCDICPLNIDCLAFKNQEQQAYPTKKIKKPIPLHSQQLLLLYNDQGLIYLEKRPPVGLWGGLWCLPSVDDNLCPIQFIKERYALAGEAPKQLMAFKHRFTHFHLHINAVSIKTHSSQNQVAEATGRWFLSEQFPSLGLAKPTSLILDQYISLTAGKC